MVEPAYCKYDYVWSVSNLSSVYIGSPVTAIQQSGDTFNFLYENNLPDLTQKQTVTVTATTYSDYENKNLAK